MATTETRGKGGARAEFLLAQISDTHVRTDDGGATLDRLRRVLHQVREYRCDAIVMTGDLANNAQPEEFALLSALLADAPAPVFLVPGNHDDRDPIRDCFPGHAYLPRSGALSYAVDEFPVRLVVVDQIVPGETHGAFSAENSEWLKATLDAAPDKPTIVALHHPPFATHDMLFDNIGLHGADEFVAALEGRRQVIRVICGHHHRSAVGQAAHAPVICAPSTAWGYAFAASDDQPVAQRTGEPPGWVLHAWSRTRGMASIILTA